MTISSQKLCFEARRKCGIGFIHTQLASSYANALQQLASSPSTGGCIKRDFYELISRQYSRINRRGLHTLFLTSKFRCMQKISSIDALLTAQNVLSWSGRFGGGHTGRRQLQLASSVSPLWISRVCPANALPRVFVVVWELSPVVTFSDCSDVIMGAMVSQITSVSNVYSAGCSGADKKTSKLRVTGLCEGTSPLWSLAGDRWIPLAKRQ